MASPMINMIGKNKLGVKDPGMTLTPWILFYFFLAVFLFLMIYCQNIYSSTKYQVEDALAAAALAGEVADLSIYNNYQEIVITDLDYSKGVFEDALQASLHLSENGYPSESSVYFDHRVPVTVTALRIYNVSNEQVFLTDLLKESGILQYTEEEGLAADSRCILQGPHKDDMGAFPCWVQMLNGQRKEIQNTSLYAKISFGVRTMDGHMFMVEKDILTDIAQNE